MARKITRSWRGPTGAALVVLLWAASFIPCSGASQVVEYPGRRPGEAKGGADEKELVLENEVIRCVWSVKDGTLRPASVTDKASSRTMTFNRAEAFAVELRGKGRVAGSTFRLVGKPKVSNLPAHATARRLAERFGGKELSVVLRNADAGLEVRWRAELRDQANSVRQSLTLVATGQTVSLGQLTLVDVTARKARVAGTVSGSPVVSGNLFFALEHPKSVGRVMPASAGENLAFHRPVSASAEWGGCKAALAVDGDHSVARYWGAVNAPVWFQVDLESPVEINKIRLVTWHNGKRVYQYRIATRSGAEASWHTVADASKNDKPSAAAGFIHRFAPHKARQVRVTILKNSEGNHFGGHIVELEVFNEKARETTRQADEKQRIRCSLARNAPLSPDRPVTETSVVGVAPAGQLRRGFLYYVERERAHPYRPFLHYNSWYDVAWADRFMSERECVEAIEVFGRELTSERGVRLDSFVFDDGWDDPKTLWRIDSKHFPNGFAPLLKAARKYKSTLGTWMSPWGGYGGKKNQRLQYGRREGFEIGPTGFSIAGKKYYARFLQTSLDMMKTNGVNFFKYDGMNAGDIRETDALIRLIAALRLAQPNLYVSQTVGTWASPYWLWLGDSIWRGAGDMGFHGPGSKRRKWITYRDTHTYRGVVVKGPLYPLNSLMTQGVAHAQRGYPTQLSNDAGEIREEFRSFFASGTGLQEMYITPQKMTEENWDDLAEAVRWSHANADVLIDTHWVGGDPGKSEVYGWASWSKRKGILTLRNPSDKAAKIAIDVGKAFELPVGAAKRYALKRPWKNEADQAAVVLEAGKKHTFALPPFSVLVYDATPKR